MKEETKRQLDEVLVKHARKTEERQQAKAARESKEEQFTRDFAERSKSVFKPAFEEIAQYLGSKGIETRIHESQQSYDRRRNEETPESIMFVLIVGDRAQRYIRDPHEFPHISLRADKFKGLVEIGRSTIGPGRGGQGGGIGSVTLDEITAEFLEEKVLGLVREILT